MNVVVIVAYNRPDYTARVLDALQRCDGIQNYLTLAHVDAGNQAVVEILRAHPLRPILRLRPYRVGCDANVAAGLRDGFALTDYLIILEDDTVPAQDLLLFHEHCREKYRDDPWIMSCSGYNRPDPPATDAQHHELRRFHRFTPWGWGTWRDRYEMIIKAALAAGDKPSWDMRVSAAMCAVRPWHEIRPILGRVQNIGAQGGAHIGPRAHRIRQHASHWAGDMDVQNGEFHEAFD